MTSSVPPITADTPVVPTDAVGRSRRLGHHGVVSLIVSLAIQGLNVTSGVLLARSLGPTGRGELAAVILWPAVLATIFFAGFIEAVTYFTSRFQDKARQIACMGLAVALIESAIIVAVGYPL